MCDPCPGGGSNETARPVIMLARSLAPSRRASSAPPSSAPAFVGPVTRRSPRRFRSRCSRSSLRGRNTESFEGSAGVGIHRPDPTFFGTPRGDRGRSVGRRPSYQFESGGGRVPRGTIGRFPEGTRPAPLRGGGGDTRFRVAVVVHPLITCSRECTEGEMRRTYFEQSPNTSPKPVARPA